MLYRAGLTFDIRENGIDQLVVDEVWKADEYRLADPSVYTMNGCVIDIGANIGAFSSRAAYVFQRQVYAYEPEPNNFELLVKNAKHANDEARVNILPINLAVSDDHNGVWLDDNAGNSGSTKTEVQGRSFVKSVTLDDIMADNGQCFYLKMDIEGAEIDVINNASPTVFQNVDFIAMEYHGQDVGWGDMIRKLSGNFDLEVLGHPYPNHNSGGMIYGKKKVV